MEVELVIANQIGLEESDLRNRGGDGDYKAAAKTAENSPAVKEYKALQRRLMNKRRWNKAERVWRRTF